MKKSARSSILLVVISVFFLGASEASVTSAFSNSQADRMHATSQTHTMQSVDMANSLLIAGNVRSATRSIDGVDTLNCSSQGYFNFTLAIEKGIEFQADVCSWECYGESKRGNMETTSNCLNPKLSCPLCYCDSLCSEYRDCCGVTPGNVSKNKTDSSVSQPSYSCFDTDDLTAVYIIAFCPARASTFTGSLDPSNLIHHSSKTPTLSGAGLHASTSDLQCNTCLSSPQQIRLVTSAKTGNTYCNHHCLYCTEARYASDADFVWRERKSCMTHMVGTEDGATGENNTGSEDVYCQTVYERPNNVSTRKCDSLLHTRIDTTRIDTCKPELLESACNLSSTVVEQLEQLCQRYISPVYTGDVIYQNIFCYLCQGADPVLCRKLDVNDNINVVYRSKINLGTLTDLSANTDQMDVESAQPDGGEDWEQAIEVNCESVYWKDNLKETCLPVVCSPGRAAANKSTSSEVYCTMDDSQHSKDIYKLFVTVYIPQLDESLSRSDRQEFDSDRMSNKQSHSYERICSDSQNRLCIDTIDSELDVATRSEAKLVSELTIEFTALCEKVGNNYGVNADLHPEGSIKQNQNEEVMLEKSEQGFSRLPTVRSRTVSDIHSDKMLHESSNHRVTPELQTHQKVNPVTDKRNLLNSVKPYFVSGMTSLGVAEYAFQLHRVQTKSRRFQPEQTIEPLEDNAEFIPCDSQSQIAAIVLVRLPSGTDRDVFESNLLHHFNGAKKITVETAVVNVEMVLSSSENVSLIAGQPVYYSSTLNKECHVFTEPDQLTQRFGDVACFGDGCRIVPFNLVSACPYVTLNISDFSISEDCQLTKDGMPLRKSQYIQESKTIDMCTVTLRSLLKYQTEVHSKVSLISIIESLLTMTSLSMSLTCLLLTFITYMTFPTLRSLPGKNNLIMVIWLFIAQLLVLLHTVPTKHSTECTAMGVLLHYSWLFTVLWMCICSFHMFHVFVIRRGVPSFRRSDSFYLTRYIVTCSTLALFVVLSVVFSKVYMSNYGNIGYGGHVCYLNSNILVGVAFILPLTVVLVLNSFFFSMTVYTISRIGDVKKHSGHERRNIHIYFRLCSLTGMCWVLALLAEIPGLRPLRCVSILVNGSQGVAIFLSYVCNRRVARMWLHLLKSRSTWLDKKPADSSRQLTLSSSL